MGIELPTELKGVAAAAGVQWPQADEEAMRATAQAWRQAGSRTSALASDADGVAGKALSVVRGTAGTAAGQHWQTFVAPDTGHLTSSAKGCLDAADRLDHAADQVGAAKVRIVQHLVTLAQHTDAANQAAAAGHPTALAGLTTAVRGTAVNVAQVNHTLTNTISLPQTNDVTHTVGAVTSPIGGHAPLGGVSQTVTAGLDHAVEPVVGAAGGHAPFGGVSQTVSAVAAPVVGSVGHTVGPVLNPADGPAMAPLGGVGHSVEAAAGPVLDPVANSAAGPLVGHLPPGALQHDPGLPIATGGGPIAATGGPALGHGPVDPAAHTPPMGVTVAQSAAPSVAPPMQPSTTPGAAAPVVPAQPVTPDPSSAWAAAPAGPTPTIAPADPMGAAPIAAPGSPAAGGLGPTLAGPSPSTAGLASGRSGGGADLLAPVAGPATPSPGAQQRASQQPASQQAAVEQPGARSAANLPATPPANALPDLGAPRQTPPPRRDDLAVFLMYLFPIGHLPTATSRPTSRQLPPPPPDTDFAAGLRFPPHDHPESHLIDVRPPEAPTTTSEGGPAPEALITGYDPLGGPDGNELDWDRRFLVRPGSPAEYAWPPGELFPEGGCADGEPVLLATDTLLDRFGTPEGRVFSTASTPFARRSLPPEHLDSGYRRYRVEKELPVWRTLSAPWFAQEGGGLRYRAVYPAADLVALGYLTEMTEMTEIVDETDGQ